MKNLLVLLTVIGVLAAAASAASGSGAGSIVISEVFAAGGNSGAPYTNDYVLLLRSSQVLTPEQSGRRDLTPAPRS
jgi:hypothetical protein